MSDKDHIKGLVGIASDKDQLVNAQYLAAKKLLDYDGEKFPSDGCAITLSVLLQESGMDLPDTFMAFELGNRLKDRGWKQVPLGELKAGDVGSTCGSEPRHGFDHIYLVLQPVNSDEMLIADNQAPAPHFRWASGKGGKTPTRFFLRAQ